MPPTPADGYADMPFPVKGVDVSGAHARQRPGTTAVGANVRTFDPTTDRARGASRPGLVRYAGQVPAGDAKVQHLNTVVICTTDTLLTNVPLDDPDPITGLPPIDDPSSAGPPGSWGRGIIVRNPVTGAPEIDPETGLPYTGENDHSRNPGGTGSRGSVFPRHVRQRGSAVAPNKNTVSYAAGSAGPHSCFQGNVQVEIHKPPPDPFGWNGTMPAFPGVLCASYNPPTSTGPSTGLVTKLAEDYILPLGRGVIPAGTVIRSVIGIYLSLVVGSDATATVVVDLVGVAGSSCSGQPCTGAPPPSVAGTGVGASISPE